MWNLYAASSMMRGSSSSARKGCRLTGRCRSTLPLEEAFAALEAAPMSTAMVASAVPTPKMFINPESRIS